MSSRSSKGMRIASIIPTRDRAHMLGDALASLLAQTRQPDTIIVIDDGSVDHTAEVLAGFGDKLTVLTTPGLGPSAARNAGLACASDDYVHFLDSDDVMLPGALAALELALTEDAAADYAWGMLEMEILPGGAPQHANWPTEPAHMFQVDVLLFRRKQLLDLGGFDERLRYGEDLDLYARANAAGWQGAKVHQVVARNRRHAGNMTADKLGAKRGVFDAARLAARRARGIEA
jgi:glycosyltransferase involved in cell wall biosynthesis